MNGPNKVVAFPKTEFLRSKQCLVPFSKTLFNPAPKNFVFGIKQSFWEQDQQSFWEWEEKGKSMEIKGIK